MRKNYFKFLGFALITIALLLISTPLYAKAEEQSNKIETLNNQHYGSSLGNGIGVLDYVNDFDYFVKKNHVDAFATPTVLSVERGAFFQNNCIFESNGHFNGVTIYGDDNIVNLVLRYLFTAECEQYSVGKTYGFFIKTRYCENIQNYYIIVTDDEILHNNNCINAYYCLYYRNN